MIQEAIRDLLAGGALGAQATEQTIDEIMSGAATPAQIAGFAVLLAVRGETPQEIAGAARAMRRHMTRVEVNASPLIDNCGTGGDGLHTFNISTAAAFVAAGAGIPVAKHGNRAASSRCGSAEVLDALGVEITLEPGEMGAAVEQVGIGFLFAPLLHGALRHAAGPRRELGVRTVFNLLGPLANPASVRRQVIGVAHRDHLDLMAGALLELGCDHALVVHGAGGADELTLAGPNELREVRAGEVRALRIDAQELGLAAAPVSALEGGEAPQNAAIIEGVLRGESGPARDVVLLNAAAAIVVAGQARDLREGLQLARRSVDSGAAQAKLDGLRRFTREVRVG